MTDSSDPPPRAAVPAVGIDAERERSIDRLTGSFARDELTMDEFERRLSLAYKATTPAALAALTADLPAPEAAVTVAASPPFRVTAVLSNVVRGGPAAAPGQLDLRSWAGNVEMDLAATQLRPGVTEINLDTILGNIDIRLPRGVQIENHSSAILGSFDCRQGRRASASAPEAEAGTVVRFSGRIVLGNVSVTIG